jgi:dihydrofolate reductase
MGRLVYSMSVSLDGYVDTPDHSLDWVDMDEELHSWFNDRARETDAFLYGRRLYEVMAAYWPTAESDPNATPAMLDFARIWNPKPKVVFSTTLEEVEWNSRLVRGDPVGELARIRSEFEGELSVGGPTLASAFIRRGLVDEYRIVVHPVVLGAGTPLFPPLERLIRLRLIETRTFASGAVYLGYAPGSLTRPCPRQCNERRAGLRQS